MRLEQRDSYLRIFDARVAAHDDDGGGWIALDRSAFYPASGGQPADTGTLDLVPVVDVALRDGRTWHRLEGPLPPLGSTVRGVLDWPRRYRHMQRHSAQHLLSQAFVRVAAGFPTRSVSLRGADCTLDLEGGPAPGDLREAEQLVNEFCYGALPITSFEVDETELARYRLRRPPKVRGRVRLVAMGNVELAACGGTHLASTAEALPIKLLGSERVRGGLTRVTFRAGWEALEDYRTKHDTAAALARALSAPVEEHLGRVEQIAADAARLREALALERDLRAADLAERLLAAARPAAGLRVVRAVLTEASLLGPLAQALQARAGVAALLAAVDGERVNLSFVRGPGSDLDLRPALDAALGVVEGRGGGRPERAQGAGSRTDRADAALAAAWAVLATAGDPPRSAEA